MIYLKRAGIFVFNLARRFSCFFSFRFGNKNDWIAKCVLVYRNYVNLMEKQSKQTKNTDSLLCVCLFVFFFLCGSWFFLSKLLLLHFFRVFVKIMLRINGSLTVVGFFRFCGLKKPNDGLICGHQYFCYFNRIFKNVFEKCVFGENTIKFTTQMHNTLCKERENKTQGKRAPTIRSNRMNK